MDRLPYPRMGAPGIIEVAPYRGNQFRIRHNRAWMRNIQNDFPMVNAYPLLGTDWYSREFVFRADHGRRGLYFRDAFQYMVSGAFLQAGQEFRIYVLLPDGQERVLGHGGGEQRQWEARVETYEGIVADSQGARLGMHLMALFERLMWGVLTSNAEVTLQQVRVRLDTRQRNVRGGATVHKKLPDYLLPVGPNVRCGGFHPVLTANDQLCAFKALALVLLTNPAFTGMVRVGARGPDPENTPARRRRILEKWGEHALALAHWMGVDTARARDVGFLWPQDAETLVAKAPSFRVVRMPAIGNAVAADSVVTGSTFVLGARDADGRIDDSHTVYLLWVQHEQHYHAITSIQEWTNRNVSHRNRVWCGGCFQQYAREGYNHTTHILNHACRVLKCELCATLFNSNVALAEHRIHVFDPSAPARQCSKCAQMGFPNDACLVAHRRLCSGKMRPCLRCQEVLPTYKHAAHQCRLQTCANCSAEYQPDAGEHRCFIQTETPPEDWREDDAVAQSDYIYQQGTRFFFFDFESQFVGEQQRHEVVFVAVKRAFSPEEPIVTFTSLPDFMAWVLHPDRTALNPVFVAHNLKGYDGRLIFDHQVQVAGQAPTSVLWNGQKIMRMVIGGHGRSKKHKVTFQDSLLHVTARLEQFPKIFGLDTAQYAKGFFPYRFATPEHADYVGPPPQRSFFEPDRMSRSKRNDFLAWYKDTWHPPRIYDFRAELERYCRDDVDILCKSMEVYMAEGMRLNAGINPLESVTCASYALKVYRTLFMPKDSIAVLLAHEQAWLRRGLNGGRTDVRCMERHLDDEALARGERLAYMDVQSMYPFCQAEKPMPGGLPQWVHYFQRDAPDMPTRPQPTRDQLLNFYGFLEVDCHPEQYQHHPAIVAYDKDLGKLVGDLRPKTRKVIYSEELKAALRQGYQVTRVYKTAAFTPRTDLFQAYVRRFLRIKLLAAGLSRKWSATDADFAHYQEQLWAHSQIRVERHEFAKNDGRKAIAKLMLNSLWGKFAQRTCYPQHSVVDAATYQGMVQQESEGTRIVHYRKQVGEDMMVISTQPDQESMSLRLTNVAMAAATSASGRLVLLGELEKLGERVLYHDTDSIVYHHIPGQYTIPEGHFVGDWEPEEDGKTITAFVAMAPKSYAYAYIDKVLRPSEEEMASEAFAEQCRAMRRAGQEYAIKDDGSVWVYGTKTKCKGFNLNYENQNKIHFDSMRAMVYGEIEEIQTTNMKFNYNFKAGGGIFTTEEEKALRVIYNKGFVNADFLVLPFGHEDFAHTNCRQPKRVRCHG